MSREKVFTSILMVSILIALSGISVWAAPGGQEPVPMLESTEEPTQEPTISGEVQEVRIDVDEETGEITVLVTLVDESGETQTVRVSVDTAKDLGLLQVDENDDLVLDPDGNPIPDETKYGTTVEIDSAQVIEYVDEDGEEAQHPVALALAEFFGLEYDEVMGRHEDGFGFGVIAKACWMSYLLGGESTFDQILDAKKNHDFSSIELPDGETPKNWGQFKKAVMASEEAQKNLNNLGAIMSRRAEPPGGTDNGGDGGDLGTTSTEGKVKGKKGKGPGEDGPPGQNKDKGGGKPDTPPGQENNGGGKGGGKKK